MGKGEGCHSLRYAPGHGKIGGDKGTVSQDREIFKARTAKTQYRKFETNVPRKGIAQGEFHFPHSCVCERFINSQDLSAYSAAGKDVDRF
jgi:hypothetical protein